MECGICKSIPQWSNHFTGVSLLTKFAELKVCWCGPETVQVNEVGYDTLQDWTTIGGHTNPPCDFRPTRIVHVDGQESKWRPDNANVWLELDGICSGYFKSEDGTAQIEKKEDRKVITVNGIYWNKNIGKFEKMGKGLYCSEIPRGALPTSQVTPLCLIKTVGQKRVDDKP